MEVRLGVLPAVHKRCRREHYAAVEAEPEIVGERELGAHTDVEHVVGVLGDDAGVFREGRQGAPADESEGPHIAGVDEVHDHLAAVADNDHARAAVVVAETRVGGRDRGFAFDAHPGAEVAGQTETENPAQVRR